MVYKNYYDFLFSIKDNESPNPATIVYNVRTNSYSFYNKYCAKYVWQTIETQTISNSSNSFKLNKTQFLLRE